MAQSNTRSRAPKKQSDAISNSHQDTIRPVASPAKNVGGRPERTVPITESVIIDGALALDSAAHALEAALKLCRATRAQIVADANAHLGRRAA